jgi:hypothetical protein
MGDPFGGACQSPGDKPGGIAPVNDRVTIATYLNHGPLNPVARRAEKVFHAGIVRAHQHLSHVDAHRMAALALGGRHA